MRTISLLLCFALIFSCSPAFFIAAQGGEESLPEDLRVGDYLINEQFTDGNCQTTWNNSFDGINYILENDAYTLQGGDTAKKSTLIFGGSYSGAYGFEVDLTHNAEKTLFFELQGPAGEKIITGRLSDKNLRISGKEADIYQADVPEANLKFLFYTDAGKFSAWVGSEQIIDMAEANTTAALAKFYIYFNKNASAASATIDNIKFYKAYAFPEDRVEMDKEWLTAEKIKSGNITESFDLPKRSEYGSYLKWTSSDTDIITIDEIDDNITAVLVQEPETDISVTLTAQLSADGETWTDTDDYKKSLTFTVSDTPSGGDDTPSESPLENFRVDDYLIDEQFTDGNCQTTWNNSFDGINYILENDAYTLKGGETAMQSTMIFGGSYSGIYGFEFDLTHNAEKTLFFEVQGASGEKIITGRLSDKNLRISGKESDIYRADVPEAKLRFLFYTDAGKFSAWVGNNQILTTEDTAAVAALGKFYFYFNKNASAASATIDNIKLYKAKRFDTDSETVLDAACLLSELFIDDTDMAAADGQISKNLKELPERGVYGSYITWQSLSPDYITDNGTLLKMPEVSTEVTLRAILRKTDDTDSEFDTKDLTYIVAPQMADEDLKINPVPTAEGSYIIDDSMRRTKFSSQLVVLGGAPAATNNGVVLNNGDSFVYMLGKDGKVYNKLIAMSFHIEGVGSAFSLYDDLDTNVFSFAMAEAGLTVWARSGNLRANVNENAALYLIKKDVTATDITIVADPITGLFSLWCGSEELVANARLGVEDCSKLKYLKAEHISNSSAVISDLKLYYPVLNAFSALSLDRAALTLESLTWQQAEHIVEDIKLPAQGRAGSTISWTSSDPDVIKVDGDKGKVKRNAYDEQDVTMSAGFNYDGNDEGLDGVEFDLTVPAGEACELPEVKKLIYEESFTGNNTTTSWSHTPSVGEIFVKNERLYFKRHTAVSAAATKSYYYFDSNLQSKQGAYGFDCTILNKAGTLKFIIYGVSDDIVFTNMTINPSNGYTTYRDDDGNVQTVSIDCSTRIGLHFFFNTEQETFSLWVNGEPVIQNKKTQTENTSAGIKRIYTYINNSTGTKQEAQIDDIRFYEAYLPKDERISLDMAWVAENKNRLVNENDPMLRFDMISENLQFPTRGMYGSFITWTPSNGAVTVDGKTGEVHQYADKTDVTLTAKFSADGEEYKDTDKLDMSFTVAPAYIENDAEAVAFVASMLTPQSLAPYEVYEDSSGTGVKRSLSLPTEGIAGCSISWSSSNTYYIDNVGRVTRPRYNEENVTVTLTAVITRGSASQTVQIPVVVIKDKEFTDPQHMPDSEFFGVWDGTQWTTQGKLDYENYPALANVEAAVKNNDYVLAKQELLSYFRGDRDVSVFESPSRNAGWANMVTDDFQHLQTTAYYRGSMTVGSEWGDYSTSIKTKDLTSGSVISFSVRAWYNEDSYAEFAKHSAGESDRPVLELTVDGTPHQFKAIDSVTVRAGAYKDTNYSGDRYLKAANYGDFAGDGLWETYLKFDVSSVTGESVSSARIILHGHSSTEQEKRLIVLYHNDNTWNSDTLTWGGITQLVYSYNGLGDRGDSDSGLPDSTKFPMERWTTFIEANNSYGQISRFNCYNVIAYEYALTGNEKYAYKAIKIAQDFIATTGGSTGNGTSNKSRGIFKTSWDHGDGGELKRGAYDTTLTSAIRVSNWLNAMKKLMSSPYMTPDFLTAMLKSIWDTADYLNTYNSGKGNWMNTEMQGLQDVADNVPEFKDRARWAEEANKFLAIQLFNNTFPDGSYIESTDSYGHGSLKAYITIKRDLMEKGIDVNEICREYYAEEKINTFGDVIGDETFDERLKKFALYQILMYAPDGTTIQYGDSGYGTRTAGTWNDVYKWFAEEYPDFSQELKYIASYGKYGTKPAWTSKTFTDSGITTLRGSWAKDSPYLFTNVRGGGSHGHRDYNTITLIGYGNTLIADSGYFEYDSTDDYRQYGVSTAAHNTVLINNVNQISSYNAKNNGRPSTGTIHSFATNGAVDYLQQSTPNNYDYGNHMRTITYLKPDLFIVSDRMVPNDQNILSNNYKQIWHMYPEAFVLGETEEEKASILAQIEDGTRKIRSNFKSGGNVLISSADVDLKQTEGWCAKLYAKIEDAPYIYYEVDEKGVTCLNTVVMTMEEGRNDDVTVETLYKNANRAALKLDIVQNSAEYTGYYLLSYDGQGGTFGPYQTDAEMAYVQLTNDGKLYRITLKGGTYIKENGDVIFMSDEVQEQVSVDFSGDKMLIEGDAYALASAKIMSYEHMRGLYIGEEEYSYNLTDGYVADIGNGSVISSENLNKTEIKGVVGNSAKDDTATSSGKDSVGGGGGAGGGGAGGIGIGGSNKTETDPGKKDNTQTGAFRDIENHWAKAYIEELFTKGIVNGDGNGFFNPDNQITRAEFIAIVTRAMKLGDVQYKPVFSDVSEDDWYAKCILQALSANLVSKDVFFRPNAPITRQEIAKIISQAMKLSEKYDFSEEHLNRYADKDSISKWAREYVSLVTQSGLMTGRDNGFCPLDNSTRAEAVTVISRMINISR